MDVLDCPRCLSAPDLLEDGVIYHCGILAANAKRWNNYVHAMRLGLTLYFSNATGQQIDFDELNESSAAFDATYKESNNA